jgi:hypothetical protein
VHILYIFQIWRYNTAKYAINQQNNAKNLIFGGTAMYEEILENEEMEEVEEVELKKDKTNAEKRRLDRVHATRKKNIEQLKAQSKEPIKTQCPAEKRMRKKVCNRKARYAEDELMYGSYKKCGKILA